MSDTQQQALFVDAIRLLFASSVPSSDLLARANSYIYEFSQLRECFFITAAIVSSPEADLSVRAFCASILYGKVRKHRAQLSSTELEQLARALVALLLAPDTLSLHNQQFANAPSATEARAFLRNVLRSLAALVICGPEHLYLVRETVEQLLAQSADRLGCHLSALQMLAALEEEAAECFLSLRQRQPLLRELRQLLGAIARHSLPPLLAWAPQSALSSFQLAALQRSVAELLRALAQSQGSVTRDLAEDGSGTIAQFLVQCATAVTVPPGDDAVQASAQANAALRAFFVRSFLLSGGEDADSIDMAAERAAALRIVSAFLHQLSRDTASLSEATRRECIATLLSLCLSGRAVEALSDDAASGGTPALAADDAQAVLLALLELVRRPPRSALLMTLDGWLDLQAALFGSGVDSCSDDGDSGDDDERDMRRSGGALAALNVDDGLFSAPTLSPSQRWLLDALLPALLGACVGLCYLPLRETDAVVDDDAWEDVAALRDGRLGLDELASLCVGAMGLRRSLALVCAATEAGDLVALEARLFILATVADRWQRSSDTAVVWSLLDGVASQAADGASRALNSLHAVMSRCTATADHDAWRWASDADESAALCCALFLRSALRFLASHTQGIAWRPESLRHTAQACLALSLGPLAAHVGVVRQLARHSVAEGNSQTTLALQLLSGDATVQVPAVVSQAAETLRRTLLQLRRRLVVRRELSVALPLLHLAAEATAALSSPTALHSTSPFAVSLAESAVSALLASVAASAAQLCDSPEALCDAAAHGATLCESLLRGTLRTALELLQSGAALHWLATRRVSQLLQLAGGVLDALVSDSDSVAASDTDAHATLALVAVFAPVTLVFRANGDEALLAMVSRSTQLALCRDAEVATEALQLLGALLQLLCWLRSQLAALPAVASADTALPRARTLLRHLLAQLPFACETPAALDEPLRDTTRQVAATLCRCVFVVGVCIGSLRGALAALDRHWHSVSHVLATAAPPDRDEFVGDAGVGELRRQTLRLLSTAASAIAEEVAAGRATEDDVSALASQLAQLVTQLLHDAGPMQWAASLQLLDDDGAVATQKPSVATLIADATGATLLPSLLQARGVIAGAAQSRCAKDTWWALEALLTRGGDDLVALRCLRFEAAGGSLLCTALLTLVEVGEASPASAAAEAFAWALLAAMQRAAPQAMESVVDQALQGLAPLQDALASCNGSSAPIARALVGLVARWQEAGASAAGQRVPPALRRAKQLLRELCRVCGGLQQAEALADFL